MLRCLGYGLGESPYCMKLQPRGLDSGGFVIAERVARQRITGRGKSSGTRATAESLIFAASTFAFERVGCVERLEHGSVAVHIR